jgi:hypothetical protein
MVCSELLRTTGTKLFIAPLEVGVCAEPQSFTATTSGVTAAGDAETVNLSAALPANVRVPEGTVLGAVSPAGETYLIYLTEPAIAGENSLTGDVPVAIPSGSTIAYPLRLKGRTQASINRQGTRTASVSFDNDGYDQGLVTGASASFSLNGNYLPNDPGYATAELLFEQQLTNGASAYVWIELPKTRAGSTKGKTYHGRASLLTVPIDGAGGGIYTGNITGNFEGKPSINREQ